MYRRNVLWMVLVAVASISCWQAAQSAPKNDDDAELYRLFVDVLENIDRSYVKPVNRRQLIESAIAGMLENLDPHSTFITQSEWKQFDRQTTGKYGGVGIQIEVRDGLLTVIAPLVGTPAYEAGILAGDRILAVNGEAIKGISISEVTDRLSGAPGTDVTLTIQHRPYTGKPFDVKLTRSIINVESVLGGKRQADDRWDYLFDDEYKIGYIRISSFVQNTKAEFDAAIQQLQKKGMRGLILDLRYNPGGLLTSAVEISDLFVKEGTIVSTKGRNTEEKVFTARAEGTLPEFPVAVLVNRYSASASEIVSACLQDHKRAVIIGERTYGKGSVQNVIELEDRRSALKLTTASYYRPNGHNIHRFLDSKETDDWGVRPDPYFEVVFSDEEHNNYLRWRRAQDQVIGKASVVKEVAKAVEKAAEATKAAEAKAARKGAEAQRESGASTKEAASKADGIRPDTASQTPKAAESKPAGSGLSKSSRRGARPEPPKHFEDRQFLKALEHLRSQLGKPQEKVAKKAS